MIPVRANVSQEELEEARKYRKNAFKRHGGMAPFLNFCCTHALNITDIDLVHIARTSAAVAGAPPLSDGLARRAGQDNKLTHASDAVCTAIDPFLQSLTTIHLRLSPDSNLLHNQNLKTQVQRKNS